MHLRVEIMCEIHFSDHKVIRIDWSLITRNPRVPDKVLVECDFKGHKKAFFTDFVICTLPLGYLKKHHESLFYPRLDSPKVRRKKRSIWQCCQLIKWNFSIWHMGTFLVRVGNTVSVKVCYVSSLTFEWKLQRRVCTT